MPDQLLKRQSARGLTADDLADWMRQLAAKGWVEERSNGSFTITGKGRRELMGITFLPSERSETPRTVKDEAEKGKDH